MASTLLINLDAHPEARDLIARMILAYGELEFVMLDTLGAVLNDTSTALRTIYQLRSESNRLSVVEAIATPWFDRAGLGGAIREAITAVYHCKNIRNQYAHCQWLDDERILRFCLLDQSAKSKAGMAEIIARPVSLSLLQQQWAYFDYADHALLWVNHQYRVKNEQPTHTDGPVPKPKRLSPPKLDSRGEKRSPR